MGAMDAMVQWKQERNGCLERSDARLQWCNAGATMQWEQRCCNGCSATRECYKRVTKTVIAETSAKRFAPGWAPGRRIDKICEKIITGTSAKELAWANAKGLYGWG